MATPKTKRAAETKNWLGVILRRIRAMADIAALGLATGALSGWIERATCLQVSGDARVFGKLLVATRSDGYLFLIARTVDGARIIAGCRYFTFDEARAHWTKTRGSTLLGEESLALVDFLEGQARRHGFMPVSAEQVAA